MAAAGTKGSIASFPVGDKIDTTDGSYAEIQKQLGTEVDGPKGVRYRMVQAAVADALAGRKGAYKYTIAADYTVQLMSATTDTPCGVQRSDQATLDTIGDLFWLQIAGVATCIDDGSGLTAGDCVTGGGASNGEVQVQAATSLVEFNTTVGIVLLAASADADVTLQLRGGL